jgi:hypothetical protein
MKISQEPRVKTRRGTKDENKTGNKDESIDMTGARTRHELRMRTMTGTKDENKNRGQG